MKIFSLLSLLVMATVFQSCAAAPFITEGWIDRKLTKLPFGASKEETIRSLGPPHFSVTIPQDQEMVEILGYQLGNYTYAETGILIYRNDKLMAVPRSHIELLRIMRMMRIINPAAKVWSLREATLNDQEPPMDTVARA